MQHIINEIKELMAKIQELQDLKENLSIDDLDVNQEELFNEMLDDCYETVTICNIEFFPSDVLKSCDLLLIRLVFMISWQKLILSHYQNIKTKLKR